MQHVKRTKKPDSLSKNWKEWTRELQKQIQLKGKYSAVQDKYKNRYNQLDVKDALRKMYAGCCCYCEGRLGIQTYGRIEHMWPKASYPERSFVWENLHWVCEICNNKKSDTWDSECRILNPTVDKIEDYIGLDLRTGRYEAVDENDRGKFTIITLELNREGLVKARRNIALRVARDCRKCTNIEDKIQKIEECVAQADDFGYMTVYTSLLELVRKYR